MLLARAKRSSAATSIVCHSRKVVKRMESKMYFMCVLLYLFVNHSNLSKQVFGTTEKVKGAFCG